ESDVARAAFVDRSVAVVVSAVADLGLTGMNRGVPAIAIEAEAADSVAVAVLVLVEAAVLADRLTEWVWNSGADVVYATDVPRTLRKIPDAGGQTGIAASRERDAIVTGRAVPVGVAFAAEGAVTSRARVETWRSRVAPRRCVGRWTAVEHVHRSSVW